MPAVAMGLLVWGTGVAAPPEERKTPPPETPAETLPPPAPAACERPCPMKILWVEQEVPVQALVSREVVTEVRRKTMEIAYRDEKRTVTETVLQPRDVEKKVTCTVLKPVTEKDPHTGCVTTVMKPVTEVQVVKETVYTAVSQPRVVIVKVPYLRPAEETIPQKTILFEYRTEMRKREYPVVVPGGGVLKDRYLLAPPPPCPAPEHHD